MVGAWEKRDGGGHGGKRSGRGSVLKADSVVLADGLDGGIAEQLMGRMFLLKQERWREEGLYRGSK